MKQTDKKAVVLGLSGGVDSATAALRLQNEGFSVTGVFLANGDACDDDARAAAARLSIDYRRVDMTQALEREVIAPFCRDFCAGQTPIPCINCNERVKFRLLFDTADELGAYWVATGHYADARALPGGGTALYKSPSANDQSYMLYRLRPEWLPRLRFPLGAVCDKSETRAQAAKEGLSSAQKPDSMEICFIPSGDHGDFIEARGATPPPGEFVDEQGRVLGVHRGIHRYTVGQRRGLGVSAEGRLYVKEIDAARSRVVLTLNDPKSRALTARDVVWLVPALRFCTALRAFVRIRHSRVQYPATVYPAENGARVVFDTPARAPSPGQSAVFYAPDGRVLGGGFITESESAAESGC